MKNNLKNPILLGEAPKGENGYPFDWNAWSSKRLAEAMGYESKNIYKFFHPKNLLNEVQPTGNDRFDDFDHAKALANFPTLIGSGSRVVCVGTRVTQVVSDFLGLDDKGVETYIPYCKWGKVTADGHVFSRIPHPANRSGRWCHRAGRPAQPEQAINFLVATIRERYPDAFSWRKEITLS